MIGTIATVVAAAASITAVVLGVDQLTSGARLRRLESALRDAAGVTTGPRAEVLASVHATVVGQLLARHAVPARRFVPGVAVTAVGWAQPAVYAWRNAVTMYPSELPSVVLWGAIGGMGVTMVVHLSAERARISRCYQRGVVPIRAYSDLLAMMEGGRRGTMVASYAFSWGATLALRVAAGALSDRELPYADMWWSLAAIALLSMSGIFLNAAIRAPRLAEPRNRDNSLRPTWVHPAPGVAPATGQLTNRPTTPEAPQTSQTPGTPPQTKVAPKRNWWWWRK